MTGRYVGHYGQRSGYRVRKAYASQGDDVTFSRFVKMPQARQRSLPLGLDPRLTSIKRAERLAARQGRTLFFKKGVKDPDELKNMLVSGHNNIKIGRDVRRGRLFRGYWIYTLTLEERATCPSTCLHWVDCYGNGMPYARRIAHGTKMLRRIEIEIAHLLGAMHRSSRRGKPVLRKGVLVRLHALGDFYSPRYVAFWDGMLAMHPDLAIYGYTAWHPGTPIGDAISVVKQRHGRRFAIRYSDGGLDSDCTISVHHDTEHVPGAIICPEQTGQTKACGTCGLCWNTEKNIAFLAH